MNLPSKDAKKKLYWHVRGGAKSGRNFSSKHFDNDGENKFFQVIDYCEFRCFQITYQKNYLVSG